MCLLIFFLYHPHFIALDLFPRPSTEYARLTIVHRRLPPNFLRSQSGGTASTSQSLCAGSVLDSGSDLNATSSSSPIESFTLSFPGPPIPETPAAPPEWVSIVLPKPQKTTPIYNAYCQTAGGSLSAPDKKGKRSQQEIAYLLGDPVWTLQGN